MLLVVVVDHVDVVVVDADVAVMEVPLLVIVRLDRLHSSHLSFPEEMQTEIGVWEYVEDEKMVSKAETSFPRDDKVLPGRRGIGRPSPPSTRFLAQIFLQK